MRLRDYILEPVEGNRSVYYVLCRYSELDPNMEMELVKQSNIINKGTEPMMVSVFRLVGTDSAIIIKHIVNEYRGVVKETVEFDRGYFTKQKEYANECTRVSKKFGIPFEVVLYVTPELTVDLIKRLEYINRNVIINYNSVLRRGNAFNKKEVFCSIFRGLDDLLLKIENMSKKNIDLLAKYVLSYKV